MKSKIDDIFDEHEAHVRELYHDCFMVCICPFCRRMDEICAQTHAATLNAVPA